MGLGGCHWLLLNYASCPPVRAVSGIQHPMEEHGPAQLQLQAAPTSHHILVRAKQTLRIPSCQDTHLHSSSCRQPPLCTCSTPRCIHEAPSSTGMRRAACATTCGRGRGRMRGRSVRGVSARPLPVRNHLRARAHTPMQACAVAARSRSHPKAQGSVPPSIVPVCLQPWSPAAPCGIIPGHQTPYSTHTRNP